MNESWYLICDRYKKDILRRKGCLVMFVSSDRRDLIWITHQPSSLNVRLAWLFRMKWRSQRWFRFVLIDETYQPRNKRCSLPPCGSYLATSNISPNNKVNTRYNGQCSEKELFAISGRQIHQIKEEIHTMMSSSEWRHEWLGSRNGPRVGSIAQLRLDELMQLGWGEAAHYFRERDMKYETTELKVPAVVKPQTDTTAATPSPITFGEVMQVLDIVAGQSRMPHVMYRQGSSQMRLGSEKPQADDHMVSRMPDTVPDSLQREIATPVQPVSIYTSVWRG